MNVRTKQALSIGALFGVMTWASLVSACNTIDQRPEPSAPVVTSPSAYEPAWLAAMPECVNAYGVGQVYPCKWDARTHAEIWPSHLPPVIVYADESECHAWELPSALAFCPSQGHVVTVAETYDGPIDVGPGDTLNLHMIPDEGMAGRCADAGGTLYGHVCRDVDF